MAKIKTVNNENYDANFNVLVETIIKEDNSIPSNLIEGGWALRTKWCFTNEEDYSKLYYGQTVNNTQYQGSILRYNGSEPNIKTLDDDFIHDNATKTKYVFEVPDNWTTSVSHNTSLKKIKLSNRVEGIMASSFIRCDNLAKVIIPTSVTFIGSQAFGDTPNLTSITYKGTISQWNSINLDSNWSFNSSITVIHCIDGDISV